MCCRLMFFERAREDAEKEVAADEKNSLVRCLDGRSDRVSEAETGRERSERQVGNVGEILSLTTGS